MTNKNNKNIHHPGVSLQKKQCPMPRLSQSQVQRPKQKNTYFQAFILSIVTLICIPLHTAEAHRGARDEIDDCRIKVGFENIHFSAYIPSITGSKTYCHDIPGLGETFLVFDYEGKKLRDITLEFEVTKEPNGERIFYQAPQKIKTGNVNKRIDFSQYGQGDYLAHITIVDNDKRQDTHLPFTVGMIDPPMNKQLKFIIGVVFFVFIFLAVKYTRRNKTPDNTSLEQ